MKKNPTACCRRVATSMTSTELLGAPTRRNMFQSGGSGSNTIHHSRTRTKFHLSHEVSRKRPSRQHGRQSCGSALKVLLQHVNQDRHQVGKTHVLPRVFMIQSQSGLVLSLVTPSYSIQEGTMCWACLRIRIHHVAYMPIIIQM